MFVVRGFYGLIKVMALSAQKDTVVLGHRIPKGTELIFPAYLGLEESSNWKTGQGEDATRKVGYWQPGSARLFDPERWLEEDGSFAANRGPSLPFGNGVRRCFGKNLAVRTAS